jgi:hypothetical protein
MNFFEPTSALAVLNSLYLWGLFFVLGGGTVGLVLLVQDWRRSKVTFKAIHQLETGDRPAPQGGPGLRSRGLRTARAGALRSHHGRA